MLVVRLVHELRIKYLVRFQIHRFERLSAAFEARVVVVGRVLNDVVQRCARYVSPQVGRIGGAKALRYFLLLLLLLLDLSQSILKRIEFLLQIIYFSLGLRLQPLPLPEDLLDKICEFGRVRARAGHALRRFRQIAQSMLNQVLLDELLHELVHDRLGARRAQAAEFGICLGGGLNTLECHLDLLMVLAALLLQINSVLVGVKFARLFDQRRYPCQLLLVLLQFLILQSDLLKAVVEAGEQLVIVLLLLLQLALQSFNIKYFLILLFGD